MTHPSIALPNRDVRSPAEVYEEQFVPALFAPWGPLVCDAARIGAGQRVLDVACGTGALSRAALERVAPHGAVVGLDADAQMLAVARRKHPGVEWHQGQAEQLPFAHEAFDRVVSQFGLMFFADRRAAVSEMWRVLRPGGRIAVAVCDALAQSPGYAAFAALLRRLFGERIADAFGAPFALGDANTLLDLFHAAGIADAQVSRRIRDVRFVSIDALVSTERACVWTLGGLLDEDQFERLRDEALIVLKEHTEANGAVRFAMPALLVRAHKA